MSVAINLDASGFPVEFLVIPRSETLPESRCHSEQILATAWQIADFSELAPPSSHITPFWGLELPSQSKMASMVEERVVSKPCGGSWNVLL